MNEMSYLKKKKEKISLKQYPNEFFSLKSFSTSTAALITPKGIDPITWDWSHFENILEENMVNFQNEGWGL